MSGEWTGGAANRIGHRGGPVPGDAERGRRLYAALADVRFWCEHCGASHPLAEHRLCRVLPVRVS